MPDKNKRLRIDDAELLFRNFAGIKREFNSEGDRNFHIKLEPELARRLASEGWRVKQLRPRDEEEGDYHLKVNVNYDTGRPPRVVVITSKNRVDWGKEQIPVLDAVDIAKADVILNGWWSDMYGGGYSAFLKSLFVTLEEDELEIKYGMPPANQSPTEDTADDDTDED